MNGETPLNNTGSSGVDTQLRAAVWESLVLDPTIGIVVMNEDGETLYCNKRQAEILGGDDAKPEDFIGQPLSKHFPPEWIEERVRLLGEVKRTGKPMTLRSIWRGKQHISQVRPIPDREGNEKMQFLGVTKRVPTGSVQLTDEVGQNVRMSEVVGLGSLDILTARELEVLALIGQGLTSKEIAKVLHRSEKTVENHRYSLSKKLEGASAVELADIALQAGLDISDAKRTRI
jgi:DNA-binding NarL/FixJ family response regulator